MLAVREKLLSSVTYATKAIKDLALKALYGSAATGFQPVFNVATADALNAPVVISITADTYHGAVGHTITVDATDDFKVAGVSVSRELIRLKWTSSKINIVELIYSIKELSVLNHGKADLKTIAQCFEYMFDINLGNISFSFQEILERKK